MVEAKEKYLRILPPSPQIHDPFKNFRKQIKELFSFSNKIRTIVDKYINEIFRYFFFKKGKIRYRDWDWSILT